MQPRSLLPFLVLALGVTAVPAYVRRDDIPNYVNSDGSIDFSALTADAAIVPTIVAPAQASNVILPIDTEAISDNVVSQAAGQADDTLAKRAFAEKRATTPTWSGYGTCGAQDLFTQAKVPSPDTYEAFRADSDLAQAAKTASKPNGYTLEYVALNGVYQSPSSNSFLGSTVLKASQGYSPQYCADYCNSKVKGCLGFNVGQALIKFQSCRMIDRIPYTLVPQIYYERDPSVAIDAKTDLKKCNNPPSVTQIVCQYYGSPVNAVYATSTGQVRGNYFRTAKAGSNGYSKATYVPPSIEGFNAPLTFGGGKIDNEKVAGKIVGTHVLTVNPDFNPQYCADIAEKTYPGAYSSFEAFMLKKNGAYVGQGCIILSQRGFTSTDASDAGQFGGKSDKYDETSVWYSSQPAYYYELNSVAATPTPPPAAAEEIITFENDQFDTSKALYQLYGKLALTYNVFGFKLFLDEVPGAATGVWVSNMFALPPKSGNFGACTASRACSLSPATPNDFTFDVKSLDLADLYKTSGTITLSGYRNGVKVVSYSVSNKGDWDTYTLPTEFSNLDRLSVIGPEVATFDNVRIVKHPVVQGKRSAVAARHVRRGEDTYRATFANGTIVEAPASCNYIDLAMNKCASTLISM